jgi:hypothetical protein
MQVPIYDQNLFKPLSLRIAGGGSLRIQEAVAMTSVRVGVMAW